MSLKKASRTKSLSLSGDDFPLRPAKPRGVFVTAKRPEDTLKIMKYIDDNVIGKGVAFLGPFGRRKVVYADYSSSGRSLQFLEDYINKEVLPALGDASCISAVTGLQSHLYDNEARDLVRAAVGATAEDEIVFCDNPVERICFLLSNAYTQGLVCDTSNNNNRSLPPILFVSTSEPIANLKVWLDGGWHVERITKNHEGFLDLVELDRRLLHYSESRRLMVGLFSGASRVTGMLADDVATTILLHQYDALSIWDHSMAASSAPICANPILPGAQKDAIFFQCRRMVGGVQAPGVLVIKKKLVENSLSFTKDTVDVVGAVRAGLVLQLKESLGVQAIMGRMEKICKQMLAHVRTIPEIALLGPTCTTAKRLTSLCFMVRHPRGAFLHHRFVVAVLNDVFGIQATADNVVADLLGINPQLAVEYEKVLNDESLKAASIHPGYIRVTFPFFMTETEVGFILEALKMVATEAWKLLPQYEVDDRTGEWRHHSNSLAKERKWLGAIRYTDGKMLFSDRRISGPGSFPQNYADCLQTARNLFNRARKMAQRSASDEIILKLPHPSVENLRWYMLPGEAHELLLGHSHSVKNTVPFDPTKIPENPSLQMIHRHHSLSALDIKRFKSRSLPASPLQVSIRRQLSGSPQQSHSPTPTPTSSPPIVRFSLGGEVTNYSPPQVNHLIALENSPSRNRCNSWGSPTNGTAKARSPVISSVTSSVSGSGSGGGLDVFGPQTRHSLGLAQHHHRQSQAASQDQSCGKPSFGNRSPPALEAKSKRRSCSCSSQTDLVVEPAGTTAAAASVGSSSAPNLPNLRPLLRGSCSESVEDIHAYVKEVTKELATEIKSEIREVISKVEDVLESTDSLDMSGAAFNSLGNISYSNDNKRDSISTSDVVDYLREFSKGMMNDVKSEIRDVVNAVDEIISPDGCLGSRKNSPPDILKANNASGAAGGFKFLTKQRFSDTVPVCRPLSTDINKHRSESFPRPNSSTSTTLTAPSPEHSAPGFPYTGAVAKSIDLKSSMSSQDSGINMCFSEQEERLRGGGATTDRNRTISARLEGDLRPAAEAPQRRVQSESTGGESTSHHHHELHVRLPATPEVELVPPKIGQLTRQQNVLKSSPSQEQQDPDSSPEGGAKWRNLPKEVWKQAAEALDDFDMIKDGDRIMVCLSGSSSSLSLLHLLRQFVRARNLSNVQLATVCFGDCGVDPRALMLYLRELGVEFFYERKESVENLQEKLAGFAYHKGYNVLAMANTLDKLADRFLVSLLNKGKLNAIQAVGPSAHLTDVRIIRPLLYIRERTLEDFASANEFPARPSRLFTRPLDAASSILRVQEANNPNVYGNIRSALKPLLALRLESTKSSYESLKASLTNRD
ncbi:uncharacterized protein LOC129763418 isoform X2 [Toxorhynchites rutilus septentrionalis]|uniref:uncharacterized protein LOC129763418 isoform X2 n=1 Tax=Toxorhynchites rutilus septentrionalis TaxID=329112 RepID=UPI0024785278|nr:uncharacterized protein LOC129763418 isoform X2 [Toxorhynchites rutilus septentrionalis]